GRFVNDLNEISRIQQAIAQLEREHRQDQLQHARHSMTEMQRRASQLYSVLTTKREEIVKKLNDGTNFVALLQNQLISDRLFDWKNRQKLAQVGVPFDNRDFLAEQNWQLHMFASWTLDLLTRGPQINDNHAHSTASNLTTLADQLTKLLFMLISQSFVVSVQPEPVLKTQHKFVTEVRLLIGDKLGIRQHLVNTNVTVKIIAEEEAKLLSSTQMNHKDIKTVGSISNDYEKMTMDERGHMAAKFNNSKLTRIAHRKPPPKGATADMKSVMSAQAATDQKYALLFHISPFQLGTLGKFDVWTLSLPLMVTVHGSQDCDAQGAIVWHRAFASVSRSPGTTDITAVAWKDLAHQNLRDDVAFSFWEWFFAIMQLIKQKLLKFWDEGWLVGFISKNDASQSMMQSSHPTFLLRFSDTQTGAVSIGFVCEDDDGQKVPFHLAPFSIKDLDQLSLAQRIASCPQLKEISEERNRGGPDSPTGYIQSEIVMVAKTTNKPSTSSVFSGGDSPSPLSVQSKLDWSPGEVIQPIQSMDM
ncbi:unnamed protein product, partial [Heligmosomoides polygyrus]